MSKVSASSTATRARPIPEIPYSGVMLRPAPLELVTAYASKFHAQDLEWLVSSPRRYADIAAAAPLIGYARSLAMLKTLS